MQGGEQGEPTLKDVVQSLLSEDCIIVSNAANYLQHLAYGDNDIKERIGWGSNLIVTGKKIIEYHLLRIHKYL